MPTYSPNRGLTVPTVGSDINTWASELNTSLGLLDAILGGSTTVAVAGSNVSLTSSQLGNAVIKLSGTLTANIELIFPTSGGGYWTVDCSGVTFGSYTITATTTGGTSALVGPGATALYSDGTNIVLDQPGPRGTYSFAGGSSDVTLTAAQANALLIHQTTANCGPFNMIFPPVPGFWIYRNEQTAGSSINVKVNGGSATYGLKVSGPSVGIIVSDGTNMYTGVLS